MMTGVKGTSHTGTDYFYYKCNNAKKKLCDKKAVQKDYIENLVIAECRKQLSTANIDKIAHEVVALCEREKDTSGIKRVEKAIKENERKQKNLMAAVAECEIESVRKSLYAEISRLNTEHDTLQNEYAIEKAGVVSLTIAEVKFFLSQLKKGRADDISYRKTLINVFVNAVYLYDDRLTIFFNSGDKPVTVDADLLQAVEENSGFAFEPNCSTTFTAAALMHLPQGCGFFTGSKSGRGLCGHFRRRQECSSRGACRVCQRQDHLYGAENPLAGNGAHLLKSKKGILWSFKLSVCFT